MSSSSSRQPRHQIVLVYDTTTAEVTLGVRAYGFYKNFGNQRDLVEVWNWVEWAKWRAAHPGAAQRPPQGRGGRHLLPLPLVLPDGGGEWWADR